MLLFCVKTIVKESHKSELEEEEEQQQQQQQQHFGRLVTFWFGTFAMLLVPLGVFFVMKTLEDER